MTVRLKGLEEFYNKNKDNKINKGDAEKFEQMITCFAPGFKNKHP